jgi:hypothetical protein
MVGGRIVRSTHRHEDSHRGYNVSREGISVFGFHSPENQYEELHWGRAGRGGRRNATCPLDEIFLCAQGYGVKENKVFQDNQSAILLEKNGRRSSSRRTRHINIRYFFVTDRIQSKELSVEYCPTGDMLAAMFTKPLQGSSFRKFRAAVLNLKS